MCAGDDVPCKNVKVFILLFQNILEGKLQLSACHEKHRSTWDPTERGVYVDIENILEFMSVNVDQDLPVSQSKCYKRVVKLNSLLENCLELLLVFQ